MSKNRKDEQLVIEIAEKQILSEKFISMLTNAKEREIQLMQDDEESKAKNQKLEALMLAAAEKTSAGKQAITSSVDLSAHIAKKATSISLSQAITSLIGQKVDLGNGTQLVFKASSQAPANSNVTVIDVFAEPKDSSKPPFLPQDLGKSHGVPTKEPVLRLTSAKARELNLVNKDEFKESEDILFISTPKPQPQFSGFSNSQDDDSNYDSGYDSSYDNYQSAIHMFNSIMAIISPSLRYSKLVIDDRVMHKSSDTSRVSHNPNTFVAQTAWANAFAKLEKFGINYYFASGLQFSSDAIDAEKYVIGNLRPSTSRSSK